jgi:hypothetical protein
MRRDLALVMASSLMFCNTSDENETQSGNQPTPQAILATGTVYRNGTATFGDWYVMPHAELSELGPGGPYRFKYTDAEGRTLLQIAFSYSFELEGLPAAGHTGPTRFTLPEAAFVYTIPYIAGTKKIALLLNEVVLAEKVFSPSAPKVTVTSPNGGEVNTNKVTVRWTGSDADNDRLVYELLISPDNGLTWEPVAGDLTGTSYVVDTSEFSPGAKYVARVIATDGINTSEDLSDSPFTIRR